MDLEKGAPGISGQISGVVTGKAGMQAGELGRNGSIKHMSRLFFIMNEHYFWVTCILLAFTKW